MVQARYVAKVLRDGGLAATMFGLAATNAFDNPAITAGAVVCGVGASLSVLMRMPLVISELNGFRSGIRRVVA